MGPRFRLGGGLADDVPVDTDVGVAADDERPRLGERPRLQAGVLTN